MQEFALACLKNIHGVQRVVKAAQRGWKNDAHTVDPDSSEGWKDQERAGEM